MLTYKQKQQARNYFKLGYSDVDITQKMDLPSKSIYVFQYRKELGIKASEILQNRHQGYIDLANIGVSDIDIATIFERTERTIAVTLWSYGFSRKEIKRSSDISNIKIPKKYAKITEEAFARRDASLKTTKAKSKIKTKAKP